MHLRAPGGGGGAGALGQEVVNYARGAGSAKDLLKCVPDCATEVLCFCEYTILLEISLRTNKGLNRAVCEKQIALPETVCRSFIFARC